MNGVDSLWDILCYFPYFISLCLVIKTNRLKQNGRHHKNAGKKISSGRNHKSPSGKRVGKSKACKADNARNRILNR
ncbi:hypothetical protein [Coprobacter tertius]|uniref:hypothetical protein n=1 Tax=Coprobacter tertius TaxID=2944915 RepID=UPI0020CC35A4|nr:hypothetical protein [Coprobacter tertius]